MIGGNRAFCLCLGASLGGCASSDRPISVRELADPRIQILKQSDALAAARGQLVLGNVGLALEEFRKVQLQRPADPEPLAGIADCYARMGRFDLSQSNYEAALALDPRDPKLLLGLAQIFELQGNADRAAATRAEAQPAVRQVAQSTPAAVTVQISAPAPIAMVGSLTVELPPARSAMIPQDVAQRTLQQHSTAHIAEAIGSVTVTLPPARPVQVQTAALTPVPQAPAAPVKAAPVAVAPAPVKAAPARVAVAQTPAAPILAAVPAPAAPEMRWAVLDANLPLPVYAATAPALPHVARQRKLLAAPVMVQLPPPPPAAPIVRNGASRPSLQRLSTGEVALITGHAAWTAPSPVQPGAPAKRVQWIALNGVSSRIEVVNAARRQGLAASARSVLLGRGWHGIAVATAGHVVEHSYVLYPRGRSGLAKRLAAQFAIRTRVGHGRSIMLVLGRDRLGLARPQRQA
jgi:hypothetical protein